MKRATIAISALSIGLFFIFTKQVAAEGQGPRGTESHGLDPAVLIGVAIMLLVAKFAGELFERLRQPAVLGELFGGILLGNLVIFGFSRAETLKTDGTIAALAELGVIILLFEVGLESDLREMMEVGWSSLLVAVLGVIAPWVGQCRLTFCRRNPDSHTSSSAPLSARRVSASRHESSKISASWLHVKQG